VISDGCYSQQGELLSLSGLRPDRPEAKHNWLQGLSSTANNVPHGHQDTSLPGRLSGVLSKAIYIMRCEQMG
jgi:hypothetical protein